MHVHERQATTEPPRVVIVDREPVGLVAVGDGRPTPDFAGLPYLQTTTWTAPAARRRALDLYDAYLRALEHDRPRRAARLWTRFAATVRGDRIALARRIAAANGLGLERAGRGPLFDRPVVHRQHRAAWKIYPLEALHGIELPPRAASIKQTWEGAGSPFARWYLADEIAEPASTAADRLATVRAARAAAKLAAATAAGAGSLALTAGRAAGGAARALVSMPAVVASKATHAIVPPDPCLIGVVSVDAEAGEWFILDRWRH